MSDRNPAHRPNRSIRTALAGLAAAAMAATALAAATAPSAGAAGTYSTPVLVVHGFDGGGVADLDLPLDNKVDCKNSVMNSWVNGLRNRGFTNVKTVGYYKNDFNCDYYVPGRADNTVDTSISQLGREFANLVSQQFSSHGTNVVVSAHSLGGMIVRRALDGVQNHHADFPSTLYVSDVVTSASEHAGTPLGWLCPFDVVLQCSQLAPGSSFLLALENNPQATNGTDWTLVGSDCDTIAGGASAVTMSRVSTSRPAVFTKLFPAPSFWDGGCTFGSAGYDHVELVTSSAPLNVIRDGLVTNS